MAESSAVKTVAYARWAIRWRWPIVLVSIALSLAIGSGTRLLVFDDDYRAFFGEDNPQLNAFEALERVYTKIDNILFVLRPEGGDVFTNEVLTAVKEFTEAGWQLPYSTRVDSLTNFQHTRAEGDDLIVEDLVADPQSLTAADLERIRQIAQSEPFLQVRMVSEDSSTTGVNVHLQLPKKSLHELPEAGAAALELRDRLRAKYPRIEIRATGSAMLSTAFAETPKADLRLLIPLMYGILIVAVLAFFQSGVATLLTVGVVLLSVLTAMGTAGWLGTQLNGVSASAPTIILTLAVANSVHILVTMFTEIRMGSARREALVESLRVNTQPVFLTSLTTAIGFLGLNFSDAPPLHHLGNITAGGVMVAWVYSMAFLPAAVAILPVRVRPHAAAGSQLMERFAEFVITHRRALGLGMGVVVIGLAAAIPLVEINDRPVEYFDRRLEFRRDADYAMKHLVGTYSIGYSIGAGDSSGINQPEYLQKLDEFANWLRERPSVRHVYTFTDVMKRLNKNMHGDDPSYYRLPEERELAAQYLLLYEMSLPYGLDVNNQINVDKSATRLDATLGDIDFKILKKLKHDSETWLAENGLPSMRAEGASPAVMFAYIAERNIFAMIRGTAVAFALISLVLVISLRSLKMGAISLIPNLVPCAMAFGIWALLYGEVGFAVSIVASVSIGIIVDDTVHFLSKYLRARREHGLGSVDAVRYAFRTVGIALSVTSAILVVGFGALATSAFWPNKTLGLLAALAIACALIADFLLLPPLLIALDRGKEVQTNEVLPASASKVA